MHRLLRRIPFLVLLPLLISLCPPAADAQTYQVVATCGTLIGPPPPLGSANGPITVDQTGKLCTSVASGGASATFGAAFPTTGTPTGFTIGGLFQPWSGLTISGANLAQVAVMDNTDTQINGYVTGTFGSPSTQVVSVQNRDPCSYAAKSSVPINVTSATTTNLIAVSGSTAVYVCGISFTIEASATSASTALFEYGTGGSCTGTTALTGTYSAGTVVGTSGNVVPTVINYGGAGQTIFTAPGSNGLCIVTAGTAVNDQGVLTYVQQ